MKRYLTVALVMSAIALAGCSESLGLDNASEEDRADIMAELEASGLLGEDFGLDGLAEGAQANLNVSGAVDLAEAPRLWGRRLGPPVSRDIRVVVEGNHATVTKTLGFEGAFMVRDVENQTTISKTANHSMTQRAALTRLERDVVDEATGRRRRWQLDSLSAQHWYMTAEDEQTVQIQRVEIFVDGESVAVIEDPSMLYAVTGRIPRLRLGQEVKVTAEVLNFTGDESGNADTYVFLHLFHAAVDARGWARIAMEYNAETGVFEKGWVVRHAGRNRLGVDAIDAGSFELIDEDNYRAEGWAIPYRIEDDLGS